jgi:ketosteroid isomerase-like protein
MNPDEARLQDSDEIVELERALMAAVQRRDLQLLDKLLGDDFTLTTGRSGNEVRTRAEWLGVTERDYVIDDFAFEELVVQHYGGCAVARSRYRQRARMGRQPRNTTYRMTDVWVRMRDGWRLQARHAQPVDGD